MTKSRLHMIREAELDPPPHFYSFSVECPMCEEVVWVYHHEQPYTEGDP